MAGLANSPEFLIGARAVQGLGGALLSPAALAILTVTFAHGRERNIAMGVWGGLAGLGGTLGVVAGGVLVDSLSWQWVFFVNVPIVIALVALIPVFVRDTRHNEDRDRTFDTAGAVLGTAGLLAVVYGVVRSEPKGWGSGEVIGFLIGGVALLVAFVLVEARSKAPLVPLRLFRSRALSVSSGALALNGAGFLSMFFLTAIYLQQVRGDSALEAGVHFLPMGGAAIVGAVLASQLVQTARHADCAARPAQCSAWSGCCCSRRPTRRAATPLNCCPGLVIFGFGILGVGVPASDHRGLRGRAPRGRRRVRCGQRDVPGRRRARPGDRHHAVHHPYYGSAGRRASRSSRRSSRGSSAGCWSPPASPSPTSC